MNGSLSDGNENIVDIFVLSTSTTGSPLQARDLENLGYRATFFSDPQQLFESLRSGKPNLLICDSVTLRQDSYDLCRTIKADYDLWVIPVLVVTSASNLSDLLHVLDCNADNFISHPFDPSYFAALIEGMLATPVERPTPEQIKTQFKIQHDDHQFVVTADRRRLLEFLLSSFEIAVNRSGDIIRITGEKEGLSLSLEKLEERIRDQGRSIEALNATLRQKEQAIGTLTSDVAERDNRIQENIDRIRKLETDIEAGKSHIADAEEEINRLTGEAAELARRYTEETGDLSRQLATISEHLAATSADLKAAEESLAVETTKKTDAETLLADTAAKKEQAERMAHELALEGEQMRADLLSEREKVQNLVTEIAALTEMKKRSEEELAETIREQKDAINKLEENLSQRTHERDEERVHVGTLEAQLRDLISAKQKTEEKLQADAETSARDIASLKESLSQVRSTLEGREQDFAGLKTELDTVTAAHDAAASENSVLMQELSGLREALSQAEDAVNAAEERGAVGIREREAALKEMQDQYRQVMAERDEIKKDAERILADRDAALATKSAADDSLREASARIRDLEAELSQAGSASAEARRQAESIQVALDQAQADARERESDLAATRIGQTEAEQKITTLAGELGQVKAELENSLRARHSLEESLTGERLEKEQLAADLNKESRERESLAAALVKEEQERRTAESERERLIGLLSSAKTEGKTLEASLSDTIHELKAELDKSLARGKELETDVEILTREKQAAEERAASLDREIDQARTALADEWEGHMDAQERLSAAAVSGHRQTHSLQEEELESEKAKKRELIVKGPDLPVAIGKHSQSLAAAKQPVPDIPAAPEIRNVEDLFEDEAEEETEDLPKVSIIQEVAGEDEIPDGIFPGSPETADDVTDQEQEDKGPVAEESDDDAETAGSGEPDTIPDEYSGGMPPTGVAFNRAQWFDLLKWAHHSGTITHDQRMQIVKMGRLIQKGRKLTHKQEEQVKEMLILVQAQGYQFP
jgi:chromosome segregation ATPase